MGQEPLAFQTVWVSLHLSFPHIYPPLPPTSLVQVYSAHHILWNHGSRRGEKKTHGGEDTGLLLLKLGPTLSLCIPLRLCVPYYLKWEFSKRTVLPLLQSVA